MLRRIEHKHQLPVRIDEIAGRLGVQLGPGLLHRGEGKGLLTRSEDRQQVARPIGIQLDNPGPR